MKHLNALLICLVTLYTTAQAQTYFSMNIKLKANHRVYADETAENLGVTRAKVPYGYALYAFLPTIPTISLESRFNKWTLSTAYTHAIKNYGRRDLPGTCNGNMPGYRQFNHYTLDAGYSLQTRKLEILP